MDILLVEDDEGIRTVLIEFLTDEGYIACGAEHGGDALALLQAATVTPRLILLDLMMPFMNGWEFRTRQQANPDWATIPVVVLTASPALLDEYGPMDVAGLLAKPIDFDSLLAVVQPYCPSVAQPSPLAAVHGDPTASEQTAATEAV
jgi:DNA-binding response OmpR family regulator